MTTFGRITFHSKMTVESTHSGYPSKGHIRGSDDEHFHQIMYLDRDGT
jgi:hypothetical protein